MGGEDVHQLIVLSAPSPENNPQMNPNTIE